MHVRVTYSCNGFFFFIFVILYLTIDPIKGCTNLCVNSKKANCKICTIKSGANQWVFGYFTIVTVHLNKRSKHQFILVVKIYVAYTFWKKNMGHIIVLFPPFSSGSLLTQVFSVSFVNLELWRIIQQICITIHKTRYTHYIIVLRYFELQIKFEKMKLL